MDTYGFMGTHKKGAHNNTHTHTRTYKNYPAGTQSTTRPEPLPTKDAWADEHDDIISSASQTMIRSTLQAKWHANACLAH